VHGNRNHLVIGSFDSVRFHFNALGGTISMHQLLPFCRLQHALGLSLESIHQLADAETKFL
jgi:hypothetical protein